MRVLQLIDSLNAGGAERVAVNFANSLSIHIDKSFICSTRVEGILKKALSKDVEYIFLNRKSTFDFKAINRLNANIKRNKIDVIHAHASSFFIATIIKILNPKVILIWHEHFGNRENASKINKIILKVCSYFFSCILAVNQSLKERSAKLFAKDVYIIPNYPIKEEVLKTTILKEENEKRIVCLANLLPVKDHINLLKAYKGIKDLGYNWTLHLIGKFYEDEYYNSIKDYLKINKLEESVFIYGSCNDIYNVLLQGDIGVLSSKSEGLPMALLEYGLCKLPVITTNVGDCNKVISNNKEGILVEPNNSKDLTNALLKYIENKNLRDKMGQNLFQKVQSDFSEKKTINILIKIYKQSLK